MFNKLITKLFIKQNPDKVTITKATLDRYLWQNEEYIKLNDSYVELKDSYESLKKSQERLSESYNATLESKANVITYVVAEYVPRDLPQINDESFTDFIKGKLANKMAEAIRDNMRFNKGSEDAYAIRYEAFLKIVSDREA